MNRLTIRTLLTVALALNFAGCAEEPVPPADVDLGFSDLNTEPLPEPDLEPDREPETDENAVTFFDLKSLQDGPGKVDDDASREFQETDSGLRYRILRNSDGQKPTADNTVTVHYTGWLHNGAVFDSSYSRGSTTFPLRGVVPGWTEGLQLVGEGGMIELWIPSNLGYGPQGRQGVIPPNATLHFVVELLKIE